MTRVLLSPWKDLERLQSELNRVFSEGVGWLERRNAYPSFNVWQNENGLLLTAELPGLAIDNLDITVTQDSVTVRGQRPAEQLPAGHTWVRKERPDAAFSRTIELPVAVDPDSAEAMYEQGVLTLRLQRPKEHRPRKVAVRAG